MTEPSEQEHLSSEQWPDQPAPLSGLAGAGMQQTYSVSIPGAGQVEVQVDLAPGDSLRITIETLPEQGAGTAPPHPGGAEIEAALRRPKAGSGPPHRVRRALGGVSAWLLHPRLVIGAGARSRVITLEEILFAAGLVIYLSTRLIGLADFPIYFFTDEAVQTVLAADFARDNFQNYDKDLFPTYFVNGSQYNLSLSVYLQVIPYLMFGKSILVTRGTSVLVTLLGAAAVGLILRDFFKKRYWWAGTLFLSIAPAWFLHSRTAFETVEMAALYACFLYFYLLYRYRSPKYLYVALVVGALVFYAYSAGQMVMAVTGLLLLFSDIRYHWQNRRVALIGLGVLALAALPYVRFLVTRGAENYRHLEILNSYLTEPLTTAQKIQRYFTEYWHGLSPGYWFFPNPDDLPRHLMKDYGHLLRITLPLFVTGLGVCLKNYRSSAHRLVLVALLAAPTGAALVHVGITRALVFVIPASLLITLGAAAVLGWLETLRVPYRVLTVALFGILAVGNIAMLRDALVNGPTWFSDYGLGGMQYGARQVFPGIKDYLKANPGSRIVLSPSWSNGTDVVARFFDADTLPVELGSIEGWIFEHKQLDPSMVFVMIPQEYDMMVNSQKFSDIRVDKTLPFPDGTPGFYFVRLRYVDQIDAILAAEKQARKALVQDVVTVDGQPVKVKFSTLDMGGIQNAFDGRESTNLRSLEANPLVIELDFANPRPMSGLVARVGGVPTKVTVTLQVEGSDTPLVFEQQVPNSPLPRDVAVDFKTSYPVTQLRLAVQSVNDAEPAHVHLWEVIFR